MNFFCFEIRPGNDVPTSDSSLSTSQLAGEYAQARRGFLEPAFFVENLPVNLSGEGKVPLNHSFPKLASTDKHREAQTPKKREVQHGN